MTVPFGIDVSGTSMASDSGARAVRCYNNPRRARCKRLALGTPMRWQVHQGDLLDVPTDVLVCSANVYLALSGGVGGAFLLRYGPAMQEALQRYLSERGIRHVEQGDVVPMPPCGGPYRAVLHAV